MFGDISGAANIYIITGYTDMRNSSEVKPITWQQFDWLMSGLEMDQPKVLQTA